MLPDQKLRAVSANHEQAGVNMRSAPGVTTWRLVSMMPRCVSTMNPVACDELAASVSKLLVWVTAPQKAQQSLNTLSIDCRGRALQRRT